MKSRYTGIIMAFGVVIFLLFCTMLMPAIAQDTKEIKMSLSDAIIKPIDTIAKEDIGIIGPDKITPLFQDDFLGTWVNVDPNPLMVRFEITEIGSGLEFHGYGNCDPTPCDWGTAPLIPYSISISDTDDTKATLEYDFGFKITRIFLTLINSNLILANRTDEYTDNSGRHNRYSDEYFVKCGFCNRLEGDVTNTGLPITGADAQLVAQHIVHIISLTSEDAQAADVNDNMGGSTPHVTGTDLQLIRQYIVHLISEFPGGDYIP